jgi:hypothetical protein
LTPIVRTHNATNEARGLQLILAASSISIGVSILSGPALPDFTSFYIRHQRLEKADLLVELAVQTAKQPNQKNNRQRNAEKPKQ